MDDSRLARIETRVDEIRDDMSELKADTKVKTQLFEEMREDFKEHTNLVKYHILGDDKIISNITPLLPDLKLLLEDYVFEKEKKERKMIFLKEWGVRLGLLATVIGGIASAIEVFR